MAKKRRLRKSGHFNNSVANNVIVASVVDNSTAVVDVVGTNVETVLEVKTTPVIAPTVIEVGNIVEESIVSNNVSVEVEAKPVVEKEIVATKKTRTTKKARTTKKSRTVKKTRTTKKPRTAEEDSPSLKLWPKRKKTVTSDED